MSTTARSANITNAAWVEIANGSANVLVDLDQLVPAVKICVASALPADTVHDGFVLNAQRQSFPLSGLAAGDKVYARSMGAATTVMVLKS